jgi:hypothetical protein
MRPGRVKVVLLIGIAVGAVGCATARVSQDAVPRTEREPIRDDASSTGALTVRPEQLFQD